MENKESYLEFISSESYRQQIDIWYKAYNISREKLNLFYVNETTSYLKKSTDERNIKT